MIENIHNYFTIVCNTNDSNNYWLEVKDGIQQVYDRFIIIPLAGDDYIVVGNKRYLLTPTNSIRSLSKNINLIDLDILEQQTPLIDLNKNGNSYGIYKDFNQLRKLAKSEFRAANNSYPLFSQCPLSDSEKNNQKYQVFTNFFLNGKRIEEVVTVDDNVR